ncbi:MAG: YwaF family protein [Oscillospiraceae bacterium]|nr:YwaF family protein [Oscillospiraceae bacterium]
MTWGFFTVTHIVTLLLAVATIFILHYALRGRSHKTQTAVLFPLSLLGIASITFNLLAWGNPWENLPLHLCAFNAFTLPLVVLKSNKTFGNVLLLWCLGALAALVLNNETADAELFSWTFFFYYFPHVMEFAIPIVLVSLGRVKKDPKCILSSVALTMGIYTCVHFINLGLNSFFAAHNILAPNGELVFANYMYSLAPNNPLSELLIRIAGQYWHMYLALPILVVYLLLVYIPEIIHYFKNRKKAPV